VENAETNLKSQMTKWLRVRIAPSKMMKQNIYHGDNKTQTARILV
jgi:hypothetical protein